MGLSYLKTTQRPPTLTPGLLLPGNSKEKQEKLAIGELKSLAAPAQIPYSSEKLPQAFGPQFPHLQN